ncbi:MAG: hypothetical protein IJ741_10830 [Schwartzia sp.]|nr:hypothetical protein [Schwartzia sp. (in: firmicutes)]
MRYINPGYAEFLDVDGGMTIESTTYNPTNGVAFYQPTDIEGVNIANTVSEFYGKFDIFLPQISSLPSNYFAKVGIYKPGNTNAGLNGVGLYKYSSSYIHVKSLVLGSNDKTITNSDAAFNFGGINHFYFYFKARSESTADGEYFIYMNGTKILEATGKWIYMDNTTKLVIFACDATPISNIILADEEISMREQIQAVPLGSPVTDMIDREDGTYLADAAGQQILQTVDVASLISQYGGTSRVTGIAVGGNPAYRTGEGITTLTGLSKASGELQTEHGAKTLRTSTTAGTVDCYSVNTTIADMAGLQLGWKAGV